MEAQSIINYDSNEEKTSDNYYFPVFYYDFNNCKFYFKELKLELGTLTFVVGDKKCGKSLLLRSLTGLEKPEKKPVDLSFLKYDIVYKPEYIEPKFEGTLRALIYEKKLENNKTFFKNFGLLDMNEYLDYNVKELPEIQKQIFSFLLLLNTDGLIYILDCPTHIVPRNIRKKMWNILRDFCSEKDKIGVCVEDKSNYAEKCDFVYQIREIADNEFVGSCL